MVMTKSARMSQQKYILSSQRVKRKAHLELLHQTDLSDSCRWCTLLRVEMNLLERDNLVGLPRTALCDVMHY